MRIRLAAQVVLLACFAVLPTTAGVVVDSVGRGWAADRAGLVPGDALRGWSRSVAGPASGAITSTFDVRRLLIEEAPLGPITLSVLRGGEAVALEVPPGVWSLRVRPVLAEELESALRHATSSAGDAPEPATNIRRLARAAGTPELGLWILERAARGVAEAGRWDEARALLDEAARRAEAAGEGWIAALLRETEGDLLSVGRPEDAPAAYEEALAIQERVAGDSLTRAHLSRKLGKARLDIGDHAGASAAISAALAVERRLAPESHAAARTLLLLGTVAFRRGDLDGARSLYEESIAMLRRLAPGTLDLAWSLNGLATVHTRQGELAEAEAVHREALAIGEALAPGTLDVAASHNNLGVVAWFRGDLAGAEDQFGRALVIQERLSPGSRDLAGSYSNLGMVAWMRGDLAGAEERYLEALDIRSTLVPDSADVATSLNNLGNLAHDRWDLARAEEYHRRALRIRQRLTPDSLDVAMSLHNLGAVAEARGDLAVAERHHRRSLAIKERLAPDSPAVAVSLIALGDTLAERGDLSTAEELLRRALALRERLSPRSVERAQNLHHLALVLERKGDPGTAAGLHARALALHAELAPGSAGEAQSAAAVARLARRGGRSQEALEALRRAVDALEAQQGKLGGVEAARTAFRSHHMQIYRDLVGVLVETGRPEEAFATLERSRARGLLELLGERDLLFTTDVPDDLERERRLTAAEYDRVQGELATVGGEEGDRAAAIHERLEALARRRQEIREEMRRHAPRLDALRYPSPVDLPGARGALDPGTALLSYNVADDRSQVFVLGPGGELTVHALTAGDEELGRLVEAFRESIEEARGGASLDGVLDAGRQLHDILIAPAERTLAKARRVLIVPDGPLHLLPFAALVWSDDEGKPRYLVERLPLHVAASVTVYAELRASRDADAVRDGPSLVAFGDPSYAASGSGEAAASGLRSVPTRSRRLGPLPATRDEVRVIAELFGESATTLLGADATEERAKAIGTGTRFVHFATHALLDERRPLDSAIVLTAPEADPGGDNGFLQAWEIFEQVRLDADLVTLSACETALGTRLAGEGIVGLTRAFQYAGARSVLASLWSVHDRSTAELMARFYRHLIDGMPKDEALRRAQLDLIRGAAPLAGPGAERGTGRLVKAGRQESTVSPFYWAAFILVGDRQ